MQWLPVRWQCQMLYLLYRWIIAIFFVVEIGVIGHAQSTIEAKYFIYLTNLGFMMLTLYTVWSATAVTYRFIRVHACHREEEEKEEEEEYQEIDPSTLEEHEPQGCCGVVTNNISWYQMVNWLLFTLGVEIALGITLLFWSLLYRPGTHDIDYTSHTNLVPHLVNGITAVLETWLTSIPIRLLHFIYPAVFGVGYVVFTGIYFAANGTDPHGNSFIYPVLDYENKPGIAIAIDVVAIIVLLPALHLLFFIQYMIRSALANWLKKNWFTRCGGSSVVSYKVVAEQFPDAEDDKSL